MGLLPAILRDAVKTLFKAVFKRPATARYPERPEEVHVPEGFRGRHWLDLGKCVGCGLCAKDCPAGAIRMVRLDVPITGLHKQRKRMTPLRVPVVDLAHCIFCYQCAESCPKKAIRPTKIFSLVATDPHDLVLDFRPLALAKEIMKLP